VSVKRRGGGPQLEVARIQSEINKLFETLLRLREGDEGGSDEPFHPPVDVAETSEELIYMIEIPGARRETIEVETRGDELIVRGERPLRSSEGEGDALLEERVRGRFERRMPLAGVVNPHKAKASFAGGVLSVRLPRVPNRRGEPVPIALD
jgi:HSP20 family protein